MNTPATLPMPIEQLKAIVEAALLASSQPLTPQQLGELFAEEEQVSAEQVARALEALAEDCDGRGIELLEVASGFRYQVRGSVHAWVARMWTERPSRYSRALMETLALIAYRQPITRPEIEQIRGVVVSSNIIKTMEEREWIRVVGHRDVPGKPALFGTTKSFLDYFNLKSLDQLPPLSEIRDMEDPQLRFEQPPLPAPVVRELSIDPEADAERAAELRDQAEAERSQSHAAATQDTDAGSIESASTETVADTSDHPSGERSPFPDEHARTDTHTTHSTADEAENPADAEHGDAETKPKEQRA